MARKASAIVNAGTTRIDGMGSARSGLASMLAPPDRPPNEYDGTLAGILFWLLIVGSICTCGGGYAAVVSQANSTPQPDPIQTFWLPAGVAIVVFACAIGVLRKRARREKVGKERAKMEHADMMKVWEDVWYCARDDVAFLVGTDTYVPVDQAHNMYAVS